VDGCTAHYTPPERWALYMAKPWPEQLGDLERDVEHYDTAPAGDVWAAGVTLYEGLTGALPYGAHQLGLEESTGEFESRLFDEVTTQPLWLHPFWPDSLKELLLGMLTKHPDQRWTVTQCLRSPWLRQAARRRYDAAFDDDYKAAEAARLEGLGVCIEGGEEVRGDEQAGGDEEEQAGSSEEEEEEVCGGSPAVAAVDLMLQRDDDDELQGGGDQLPAVSAALVVSPPSAQLREDELDGGALRDDEPRVAADVPLLARFAAAMTSPEQRAASVCDSDDVHSQEHTAGRGSDASGVAAAESSVSDGGSPPAAPAARSSVAAVADAEEDVAWQDDEIPSAALSEGIPARPVEAAAWVCEEGSRCSSDGRAESEKSF